MQSCLNCNAIIEDAEEGKCPECNQENVVPIICLNCYLADTKANGLYCKIKNKYVKYNERC